MPDVRCGTHSRVSCPSYACQQEAKASRTAREAGVVRFSDPYRAAMLDDDEEEDEV